MLFLKIAVVSALLVGLAAPAMARNNLRAAARAEHNGNTARAERLLTRAAVNNGGQLGGHAAAAKQLIAQGASARQVNQQIRAAAGVRYQNHH